MPYKPRPEGWSWSPPVEAEQEAHLLVAVACGWCSKTFEAVARGGSTQGYCDSICKGKAQNARRASRVAS